MTGRGADYIIIDDPLKPDQAFSELERTSVNDWFDHTLYSRLNNKRTGRIIIITQRLHEDDLVGHVLKMGGWTMLCLPAIAEREEEYVIDTPYGKRRYGRGIGEPLHPERESLELLNQIREIQGEYNFAGQYQQAPAPLGGGMIKTTWFRSYSELEKPSRFDYVFQSWDTANKPTELSDYSVCTTWGVKDKHLFLQHVYRNRLGYPELKRAVREQAQAFGARTILIEDKASGTQLIQDLIHDNLNGVTRYATSLDKIMRMHSVSATIENGFVHLPEKAPWLAEYLHELSTFANGRYDDQVDSTSQALDWFKQGYGLGGWALQMAREWKAAQQPKRGRTTCTECGKSLSLYGDGFWRCNPCGIEGRDQCA